MGAIDASEFRVRADNPAEDADDISVLSGAAVISADDTAIIGSAS